VFTKIAFYGNAKKVFNIFWNWVFLTNFISVEFEQTLQIRPPTCLSVGRLWLLAEVWASRQGGEREGGREREEYGERKEGERY
jgi:hypothetical protein